MGKPIGYNPARLQRAYLPMPGIELIKNVASQRSREQYPHEANRLKTDNRQLITLNDFYFVKGFLDGGIKIRNMGFLPFGGMQFCTQDG